MKKIVTMLMLSSTLLAGCASITRGTNDVLVVNTEPADARVHLSSGQTCIGSPCTFRLPRNSEVTVEVTHPRCRSRTANVTHVSAPGGAAGMAGNIVFGGVIGAGVDAATGATQNLTPNPLNMRLECDKATAYQSVANRNADLAMR